MSPFEIFGAVGAVVSVASVVANFTETKKDDKAVAVVKKIINIFALNFSHKAGK